VRARARPGGEMGGGEGSSQSGENGTSQCDRSMESASSGGRRPNGPDAGRVQQKKKKRAADPSEKSWARRLAMEEKKLREE